MSTEKTDFIFNKHTKPTSEKVNALLGNSAKLWEIFLEFIESEAGTTLPEWKYYTKKSGWTMKLMLGKRNLFFFKPQEDNFAITFVFGDRAVNAVLESDFPESIRNELQNARKYMEGRGLRCIINSQKDIEVLKKLLKIKLKY